jgi:hypothetical protein
MNLNKIGQQNIFLVRQAVSIQGQLCLIFISKGQFLL